MEWFNDQGNQKESEGISKKSEGYLERDISLK